MHVYTQTHTRLYIGGATRASEQINYHTPQLAHLAREEMTVTGPWPATAHLCVCLLYDCVLSALSDLIPQYSVLLYDSCPLARRSYVAFSACLL